MTEGPASPSRSGAESVEAGAGRSPAVLSCRGVTLGYGAHQVLEEVDLDLLEHRITAIIGPSGCGKSTLIRTFNRMNDFVPGFRRSGLVCYRGTDLYGGEVDPVELRRQVGMVFQRPNPFPKSIYDNIAWGPRIHGYDGDLGALAEQALRRVALWSEVRDRLRAPAFSLSAGQQQRLCLARTLAMEPDVVLMDEPCSSLDPVSTGRIEDLMFELRERYTIVVVTHNLQQASRVSDHVAFFDEGVLVEYGETERVFTKPEQRRTEDYVMGRFG